MVDEREVRGEGEGAACPESPCVRQRVAPPFLGEPNVRLDDLGW